MKKADIDQILWTYKMACAEFRKADLGKDAAKAILQKNGFLEGIEDLPVGAKKVLVTGELTQLQVEVRNSGNLLNEDRLREVLKAMKLSSAKIAFVINAATVAKAPSKILTVTEVK
jgi:hypothetical protein